VATDEARAEANLFASAEQEGERQSQSDKSQVRQNRPQAHFQFSIFNFQFSIRLRPKGMTKNLDSDNVSKILCTFANSLAAGNNRKKNLFSVQNSVISNNIIAITNSYLFKS
jgi:hypothetical protein